MLLDIILIVTYIALYYGVINNCYIRECQNLFSQWSLAIWKLVLHVLQATTLLLMSECNTEPVTTF